MKIIILSRLFPSECRAGSVSLAWLCTKRRPLIHLAISKKVPRKQKKSRMKHLKSSRKKCTFSLAKLQIHKNIEITVRIRV